LGTTSPPIEWVMRSYPGGKWLGCEVNHSAPYSVQAKRECSCTSVPSICLHGIGRDNFTPSLFILFAGINA
jgi:hypothetical protein